MKKEIQELQQDLKTAKTAKEKKIIFEKIRKLKTNNEIIK
jgi:hypothetical protein